MTREKACGPWRDCAKRRFGVECVPERAAAKRRRHPEGTMPMKIPLLSAALALVLLQAGSPAAQAQTALAGQVTSAEEGAMEGVLVSAKKTGSTITITAVSDAQGRYSFPSSKLAPGQYAIRIRAIGYDLESPTTVE